MPAENFSPSEHDTELANNNREEIKDPERRGILEVPLAQEQYQENEGKLLISPENLMPENISVVVGARSAEKGSVEWSDRTFASEAGIDPNRAIRVQQGHTGNVIEVSASQAPAFDLIKDENGKVIQDKRLQTPEGSKVDAAWTKDSDLTLMIGSADCAAVTIAGKDENGKDIVGIAHSGIAGAQKDITGNLLQQMIEKGQADLKSLKVYVAPSICEKCFPILSEALPKEDLSIENEEERTQKYDEDMRAAQERIEKGRSTETVNVKVEEDNLKLDFEVNLTMASASFKAFAEKYGQTFKDTFGRELSQNDFFYIARNEKGEDELHYRVDNQILLSLIGNGVPLENIGFSSICTKNDGLPSARGTKETTGVYTTIKIKT